MNYKVVSICKKKAKYENDIKIKIVIIHKVLMKVPSLPRRYGQFPCVHP